MKLRYLFLTLALITFTYSSLYAIEPFLNTQLLEASSRGDTDIVRNSLYNGAMVDARDRMGNTALILASDAGYQEIVRLLLAAKASVNAVNKFGYTPLLSAVTNSHRHIAALLISAGADAKLPNKFGTTAETYIRSQGFFTMQEYISDTTPAMATDINQKGAKRGAMGNIHNAPWREDFNRLIALNKTSEAADLLITHAKRNNYEAAYLLGTLFLSKGNPDQGIFWLRKATESKNDVILYLSGKAIIDYGNGAGLEDAIVMLKRAIEAGNDYAKVEYGKMQLFGMGVPKDNAAAYMLFNEAATADIAEAIYYAGILEYMGRGTIENKETGTAKVQMAADLGYKQAQIFMDKMNADKQIAMLSNSRVGDRASAKAMLVSQGIPINMDDPKCDIYKLGNAWNEAYNISQVNMCYPGNEKVESTFLISGIMPREELQLLARSHPNALFKIDSSLISEKDPLLSLLDENISVIKDEDIPVSPMLQAETPSTSLMPEGAAAAGMLSDLPKEMPANVENSNKNSSNLSVPDNNAPIVNQIQTQPTKQMEEGMTKKELEAFKKMREKELKAQMKEAEKKEKEEKKLAAKKAKEEAKLKKEAEKLAAKKAKEEAKRLEAERKAASKK